jgi:hypothetical protein
MVTCPVADFSLILSKFTNWVLGNFCRVVGNSYTLIPTKNYGHQMHRYRKIRKISLSDGGQFLKKYKLDLFDVLCVFPPILVLLSKFHGHMMHELQDIRRLIIYFKKIDSTPVGSCMSYCIYENI